MLKATSHEPDYQALAGLFNLFSNPIRLQILDYLLAECCKSTKGCCSVTEIYTELGLPQPQISKHLKILKASNILSYQRKGNKILYYFTPGNKIKLVSAYISRFPASGMLCCK